MEDFFRWMGEQLGDAIRLVVESLSLLFAGIDDFVSGLTGALGMNATVVSVAFLLLGLFLLYAGVRNLVRGAFVSGFIWLGLALLLLGWLID